MFEIQQISWYGSMTRNQRLKFPLTSVSAGFCSKISWTLHVSHTIHVCIFTYIWLICMVNVGKYTIHGSHGYIKRWFWSLPINWLSLETTVGPSLFCQLHAAAWHCKQVSDLFVDIGDLKHDRENPRIVNRCGSHEKNKLSMKHCLLDQGLIYVMVYEIIPNDNWVVNFIP